MFVFGELVAFETEDVSTSADSPIFVMYKMSGKTSTECTVPTRGVQMKESSPSKRPKTIFLINRPFTQIHGQRMLIQLIQYTGNEKQKLIGYGYCDLEVDKGCNSRAVRVPLWHPRSQHHIRNEICGVISPLADFNVVELPQQVNRKALKTTAVIGELVINIQKSGYN